MAGAVFCSVRVAMSAVRTVRTMTLQKSVAGGARRGTARRLGQPWRRNTSQLDTHLQLTYRLPSSSGRRGGGREQEIPPMTRRYLGRMMLDSARWADQ